MAMTVTLASGRITVTPGSASPSSYSLEGAHLTVIPARPATPTGPPYLSTMPSAGATTPPQQYSPIPQKWRVKVLLEGQCRELLIPMGEVTNQGTWLNTQAGAEAAVTAISAAIPFPS